MKRTFQFLVLTIIAGVSVQNAFAEGKGKGNVICNSQVVGYLKSVGFSSSEVKDICRRARSDVRLNEDKVNKYQALALNMEEIWRTKHPSKPISQGVINHAVRLMRPNVCNEHVARYLKSEGFQIDTVRDMCRHAESLMETSDLTKTEAMRKTLFEYSDSHLRINDNIIKEVMRLMK